MGSTWRISAVSWHIRFALWKAHPGYYIETGLERTQLGGITAIKAGEDGGLDQKDSNGEGEGCISQQDLTRGFRMWDVPNILLTFLSLPPTLCLLKSHEISLVLTTHNSATDSQTVSLAPTSHNLQVQISIWELPTDSNLTLNIT